MLIEICSAPIELLEISEQGPHGPPGPQGLSGSAVSSYFSAVGVSGHIAVVLDADGQCRAADASVPADHAVAGLTIGAAAAGAPAVVVDRGILEHSGWSFSPGSPVFLGLAGAITQTLPESAAFCKVLGVAVSPTRISVNFQPAIFK